MEQTPRANRVHIGFFGRRNAGKSSLINAIAGQTVSVVSPVCGTTTDTVEKAMELLPIGAVVLIDTPGLDDVGTLGSLRVRQAKSGVHPYGHCRHGDRCRSRHDTGGQGNLTAAGTAAHSPPYRSGTNATRRLPRQKTPLRSAPPPARESGNSRRNWAGFIKSCPSPGSLSACSAACCIRKM